MANEKTEYCLTSSIFLLILRKILAIDIYRIKYYNSTLKFLKKEAEVKKVKGALRKLLLVAVLIGVLLGGFIGYYRVVVPMTHKKGITATAPGGLKAPVTLADKVAGSSMARRIKTELEEARYYIPKIFSGDAGDVDIVTPFVNRIYVTIPVSFFLLWGFSRLLNSVLNLLSRKR